MQENLYFSATANYGQKKTEVCNSLFDVTMGSFDGAEICELVGLFILNHLGKRFGKENIGLYRDDGLAIIKSKSARLLDKTRKELYKIFEQFDLKITAEVNMNVVNFLVVNLINAKHKPYRKPNDDPLYINRHSNHPPSITRQLPTAINKRIALLSSDEQTFKESTPIYQSALRHSNFDHEFTYTQDAPQRTRRNRQRNIIWFNPPFSKSVNTNIGRELLSLIDKHFPLQHKLHKIFNRNTLKVSYSCTFKERYANHTSSFRHKKRLKQNGTFETYLEIKRKQSGLYHQMVNFKTRYFVHRGIKTLQFMFGRKILHFERHKQRQFTQ